MQRLELVFVPTPGVGHLRSAIEIGKLLINRDRRLSVTVLIIQIQDPTKFGAKSFIDSVTSSIDDDDVSSRMKFVRLPFNAEAKVTGPSSFTSFIDGQKPFVRDAVATISRSDSSKLAALVLDMFCTSMTEVADEFGVSSYVYFTCNASYLGFCFHLQTLLDEHADDIIGYKESETALHIPTFVNPVPVKYFPSIILLDKSIRDSVIKQAESYRKIKGIIVNTFLEIESYAIQILSEEISTPIYPVGPVISHEHSGGVDDDGEAKKQRFHALMKWLDNQATSSVVFLCFGSMGTFSENQVKEIAHALEQCGHGFLWSLRRPSQIGRFGFPEEYQNLSEVLPEGFLEKTADRGKIIGWAPQLDILSHPAIGGFVSHCGWNSTLESIWSGVPIAAWPLFAEQQMNAFQIVKSFGLGVEVKMDYIRDINWKSDTVLTADLIENAIRRLMTLEEDEDGKEINRRVKEVKEKSRAAMAEGGSSHATLGRLIDDIVQLSSNSSTT